MFVRKSMIAMIMLLLFMCLPVCSTCSASSEDAKATSNESSANDWCPPRVPLGRHSPAPVKADRLRDIVGWAEDNIQPVIFNSVWCSFAGNCFVLRYDLGSGAYAPQYMVYMCMDNKKSPTGTTWYLQVAFPSMMVLFFQLQMCTWIIQRKCWFSQPDRARS